jgi:hypothetical protein
VDLFEASLPARWVVGTRKLPYGRTIVTDEGPLTLAGKFRASFREAFRILHTLTLEVFGALFLALALLLGAGAVQQYQAHASAPEESGVWGIILAVVFSVAFLSFGIHNFWKAWRMRK